MLDDDVGGTRSRSFLLVTSGPTKLARGRTIHHRISCIEHHDHYRTILVVIAYLFCLHLWKSRFTIRG